MTVGGLPHSGTPGSQPARGSPGRIVVRHALRRLSAPRHPPVALCSLITSRFGSQVRRLARRDKPKLAPPAPPGAQDALVYTCKAFPFPVCSFQGAPETMPVVSVPGVKTPVCTSEVRLRGLGHVFLAPPFIDGTASFSRMRIPEN